MTLRWRPPLPSFGRMGGAPVADIPEGMSLLDKLEEFYTERDSVSDIFVRRVSARFHRRKGLAGEPRFLREYEPWEQSHLLLSSLYFKASDNFKMKLRITLQKSNGLLRVRQWYHTANAAVLPLLLSWGEDLEAIDNLTRWALENCANNYALFLKRWKSLKKILRMAFAKGKSAPVPPDMRTYARYFYRVSDFSSPEEWGRYVLLWTQTRACGLADAVMIDQSINKFVDTVTHPVDAVTLDPGVLLATCKGALGADARHAKVSVGSTSCLESTRQLGGKSAKLAELCKTRSLHTVYDPVNLEPVSRCSRPVSCARDVLYWATQVAIEKRTYTRCVRVHAVSEPGKARTITVAPYAYQVIMGVFAHIFQATLTSKGVKSGLTRDRHLWRFLSDSLNPQNTMWEHLDTTRPVYALSTDFAEATDYGNPIVARQVWDCLIGLGRTQRNFPLGLALLAKTLYCSRRFIFVPVHGGYKRITSSRGWFMGDMMTKVILTIVHDYTMRLDGLKVYSLVGDDETVLSNDAAALRLHLRTIQRVGLKISELDTFVSRKLMFYCEEGALVPQGPSDSLSVSMRRGVPLGYLDYPRIRLLLAQASETDSYSMTNIGRFSLLGKETRWCHSVNPAAARTFDTASLLQHIMVPKDADTLCPYTPIEVGGDGSYPPNSRFLERIARRKSRDFDEIVWRLYSLLSQKFSYKFVRSQRLNEVVHKHHIMLPALSALKQHLPPEAVVVPKTKEHKLLLRSVKVPGLETPQVTWTRLCKSYYWKEIFSGRVPYEPTFEATRSFSGGKTYLPNFDWEYFYEFWRNPGFRYAEEDDYYVVRDLCTGFDPLNLQWKWKLDDIKYPSARDMFKTYLSNEVDFVDASFPYIYDNITKNAPLPERVVKRLNLFMESDNYILSQLEPVPTHVYYIVTRDLRLCADIRRKLSFVPNAVPTTVYALDPVIYLTGMLFEEKGFHTDNGEEIDVWRDVEADFLVAFQTADWVEDPGSILHTDYTEFQDGRPIDDRLVLRRASVVPHRSHRGVIAIRLDH